MLWRHVTEYRNRFSILDPATRGDEQPASRSSRFTSSCQSQKYSRYSPDSRLDLHSVYKRKNWITGTRARASPPVSHSYKNLATRLRNIIYCLIIYLYEFHWRIAFWKFQVRIFRWNCSQNNLARSWVALSCQCGWYCWRFGVHKQTPS